MKNKVKRIAIFASGSGSNAEKIIVYFKNRKDVKIEAVYSNRKNAMALKRADNQGVISIQFNKTQFLETLEIIEDLKRKKIDLIVLAGFLLLVPHSFVEAFPNRIVNIHPALLPKYGGKGMYGNHVHKAVSENGDSVTGITVHFVNHEFDKGEIIAQIKCVIVPNETPERIASKVLKVEHLYYPLIIDQVLANINVEEFE
ncbi:MAG: phosphoribosylglycinamide formyltransferase [Saprospiraceae bacterium]